MTNVISCPVCRDSMKEMVRSGVTIDVCVRCHGVWLDRGELEEILSSDRHSQRGEIIRQAYAEERRECKRDERDFFDDHFNDDSARRFERSYIQQDQKPCQESGIYALLKIFR